MKHRVAILWFRRDLRLADNPALHHALADAGSVIPVFILSTWRGAHRWTGANRQHFLAGCLASLSANLAAIGGRLLLREGDAVGELALLASESGATGLFYNRDCDPFGREVEKRIAADPFLSRMEIRPSNGISAHWGDEVRTAEGGPFRVFTPYSRAWKKLEHPAPLSPPGRFPAVPEKLRSLALPDGSRWFDTPPPRELPQPGEQAARNRLETFLAEKAAGYADLRNFPGVGGTSRLSQDLRFGTLSAGSIVERIESLARSAAPEGRRSLETFLGEIIWREFYLQILWHFPGVLREEFNPKFRGLGWPGETAALVRWQQGTTGFPIVDAGMRELLETGFMHNRARMITSMFLTKDLHVDWREGESWFMRHLADGEIASNNGGWQWSAGTGADAAPYFRIQNPWTQTLRHDPDGSYIKKWVPELRDVPAKHLCEPPEDGRPIARGYPAPMVNHAVERDATLAMFNRKR